MQKTLFAIVNNKVKSLGKSSVQCSIALCTYASEVRLSKLSNTQKRGFISARPTKHQKQIRQPARPNNKQEKETRLTHLYKQLGQHTGRGITRRKTPRQHIQFRPIILIPRSQPRSRHDIPRSFLVIPGRMIILMLILLVGGEV